jgi:hypothetical protein
MRNPKSYAVSEVFENAEIDFIFEFYTSKKIEFIGKDLSDILGKQVIASTDESHIPSWSTAILLQEFKADRSKYVLKVGPQQYNNIKPNLRFLLMWINENANLDYSTGLEAILSFNHQKLQTLQHISNMNIGKMLLKINENFIYEKFESSKNNAFAMSIKKLIPLSNFINAATVIHNLSTVFSLPISEHYGIDFTDYTHGNLKFNYIRGNYSEKPDEIEEVLEYYVLTTYQTLNEPDYTLFEENELAKLTKNYLSLKNSWYNSEKFIRENKDLKIMVDLNTNPGVIQTHWDNIRKPLFKILFESGGKITGKFNWDSEEGIFQLKGSEINGCKINNIDFVDCKLNNCILENVQIWASEVNNSILTKCNLVSKNEVTKSKMTNVRADRINKINESFIVNNGEMINCKVNNTIVKNAGIGKDAKLDESSVIIETREFQPQMLKGVESPEIRDYNWIKSLRDDDYEDLQGFANEFKTDY